MADQYAPSRPSGGAGVTKTDAQAIYHDVSPTVVFLVRLFNFVLILIVLIAFILSLVQGKENKAYYLLACNIVISSFVGLVVNWWYRTGDLGPEKFWYILLVGGVIAFQCITTDVFVFHVPPVDVIPTSTPNPNFTRHTVPHNHSNTTNHTHPHYNWVTEPYRLP